MANYSPKIDLVFRKLFGSEENKDLLLSLINGIIETPVLTDLTIKNPYNLGATIGDKSSILDIKAVGQDGVWCGSHPLIDPAKDGYISSIRRT